MSSATWRNVFTFNKYSQICSRAVRQSLQDTHRVAAERRGHTILRYQQWENGTGGKQVLLNPETDKGTQKSAAV
ncbi:hypothetical protein HGRIS_012663 [Hohenbuehelia grisea]|uniref:Mitochondrial ATP synthase epsilon chain n=1 Tax=Hohenbuehelia grisea TaxID=104357 RepID=A0ABR3IT95_9AGAR